MFSGEFRDLIIKVITSWQVIVVTIVVLVYIFLVNSVSKSYTRSRKPANPKPAKAKPPKGKQEPDEQVDDSELGLED